MGRSTSESGEVPATFELAAFEGQWFSWRRVNECFWPGMGRRSKTVDQELSPVRDMSGVYLIAWGDVQGVPQPDDPAVQYVGMTENFKNRMGQFAASAGLHYDERYSGHSAGWRWPLGRSALMHLAFFPLQDGMPPHLKTGLLHWYEALAIDMYFKNQGAVPPLNAGDGEIDLTGRMTRQRGSRA